MNQFHVDDRFNNALRAELVAQVQSTSRVRARQHTRLWLGGGALVGACLLGGIGAAAAGLFQIPGGLEVTPLASPVTESYAGTAAVELDEAPAGATDIEMTLTALTPGWFEFPNGASCSYTEVDIEQQLNFCRYTMALEPGQTSVTIGAEPTSRWQLSAKYVKQERTELGVNAKGETYGMESPENGVPDLIAVMATNGATGYVYAKELYGGPMPTSPEDAVKNFSTQRPPREIPVFLGDGETKVGVFLASGGGGGIPSYPSPSPRP
jgi:hypothetical protein